MVGMAVAAPLPITAQAAAVAAPVPLVLAAPMARVVTAVWEAILLQPLVPVLVIMAGLPVVVVVGSEAVAAVWVAPVAQVVAVMAAAPRRQPRLQVRQTPAAAVVLPVGQVVPRALPAAVVLSLSDT